MSEDWGKDGACPIEVLPLLQAIRKRPRFYMNPDDPLLATRFAWACLRYAVGATSARIDIGQKRVAVVTYRGMGLARMGPPCPGFHDEHEHTPELRREMLGPHSLRLLEDLPGPGPAELWQPEFEGSVVRGEILCVVEVVAMTRFFEAIVSDAAGQFTSQYRDGVCTKPVETIGGPDGKPPWVELTFELDPERVPSLDFDAAWLRNRAETVPFPVEVVS